MRQGVDFYLRLITGMELNEFISAKHGHIVCTIQISSNSAKAIMPIYVIIYIIRYYIILYYIL